jgi:hypothetical protein
MKALTTAAIVLGLVSSLLSGVARGALSWFPDDGCRTGLSADSYFYAGGPASGWSVVGGGSNNCHLETYTVTGAEQNFADWYMPINASYNGTYSDQAYISSAGPTPHTAQADYFMYANGHSGGITQAQVLDQAANQGGFCYIFGPNVAMNGSNGGFAEIVDQNTLGDGYLYVDLFCFTAQ